MKNFSEGVTAIVDVQREFSADVRAHIGAAVAAQPGVRRAQFSPFVPRVLLVQYDSATVSAGAIRDAVQAHVKVPAPGARLVGM
jgi:hypothetical protein